MSGRAGAGVGGLWASAVLRRLARAAWVSPQALAGHPKCRWSSLTPFHRKRCTPALGCWPTVPMGAFTPSETWGSQRRGGGWFPSWCNPQKDASADGLKGDLQPCRGSTLSGCSLPLPKGKENFCHDHEYFFLLGQLLHLFSQDLRQRSDSKVHGTRERRGPRSSSARLSPLDFLPKKILAEKPGIIYK